MGEVVSEDTVYIGEKPASVYTLRIMTLISKRAPRIVVKARGREISKLALVCETVRRLTGGKVRYGRIELYSEQVGEPGREKSVPALSVEIVPIE